MLRKDTQVSYVDEPGSLFGEMSVPARHALFGDGQGAVRRYRPMSSTMPIGFLGSQAEIALELASLLARRLYYTTSYLVDLQQQAAGRREDLDLVDKILAQLAQSPDEGKGKGQALGWRSGQPLRPQHDEDHAPHR